METPLFLQINKHKKSIQISICFLFIYLFFIINFAFIHSLQLFSLLIIDTSQ
jgi:hypothetical protein